MFLDRDGVLNQKMPEGEYVRSWSDFHLLPGVPEAIARLNRAGLLAIVVSNQRGISQSLYTAAAVEAIHSNLQQHLQAYGAHVDGFFYCPHGKTECNCRKPLPGLYEQARARFPQIAAESGVVVGDSLSDVEFGHRLGMKTIFIESDPERRKPGGEKAAELADASAESLPEAVDLILDQS